MVVHQWKCTPWKHIAARGSLVNTANTKRMRSGTWEKETDQQRQTRENIWPYTNEGIPGRNMCTTPVSALPSASSHKYGLLFQRPYLTLSLQMAVSSDSED
ncbi:hypothetical protein M514_06142 [Trichuris suis]|uniref:Uncharacterized protein n=1 Tax=Trichuris suis TaxID=68888 RepID=A0A085NK38_9BILA|nr:hypothetical protein M513_06142 [Trichuris suis]KFD69834.1 hypothetical protein M514_06142 [Trichuris suis]